MPLPCLICATWFNLVTPYVHDREKSCLGLGLSGFCLFVLLHFEVSVVEVIIGVLQCCDPILELVYTNFIGTQLHNDVKKVFLST